MTTAQQIAITGGGEDAFRQRLIDQNISPVSTISAVMVFTHLIKDQRALCHARPPKQLPYFDPMPWERSTCKRCLAALAKLEKSHSVSRDDE